MASGDVDPDAERKDQVGVKTAIDDNEEEEEEEEGQYVQLGNLAEFTDEVTPLLSSKHVPLVMGKVTKEAAIATHSALRGGMSSEKEQQ
uniref:Uncharacterized protein n=1 Tax=Caenorhabditis japonica TaxID=281687 RepID=A0A8R1I8F1_CAEJA